MPAKTFAIVWRSDQGVWTTHRPKDYVSALTLEDGFTSKYKAEKRKAELLNTPVICKLLSVLKELDDDMFDILYSCPPYHPMRTHIANIVLTKKVQRYAR